MRLILDKGPLSKGMSRRAERGMIVAELSIDGGMECYIHEVHGTVIPGNSERELFLIENLNLVNKEEAKNWYKENRGVLLSIADWMGLHDKKEYKSASQVMQKVMDAAADEAFSAAKRALGLYEKGPSVTEGRGNPAPIPAERWAKSEPHATEGQPRQTTPPTDPRANVLKALSAGAAAKPGRKAVTQDDIDIIKHEGYDRVGILNWNIDDLSEEEFAWYQKARTAQEWYVDHMPPMSVITD